MEKKQIQVGEFTIREMERGYPDGSKSVWIQQNDGEGGQFLADLFEKAIREFYDKYF